MWHKRFVDGVVYDVMRCCLGFSVKAMCGGKFDLMFCLDVLIDGFRRFIYLLFQMGWLRFGKVHVIIHLYLKNFSRGWTMCAFSYLMYHWYGVSKESDGKSAGGRRYSSVPLYLRMVPL